MKKCRACLLDKPFSEFNVDRKAPGGYNAKCRSCAKLRAPCVIRAKRPTSTVPYLVRHKASTHKYEKTKNGFLMRAYRNMLSRVTGVQKLKAHIYLGLEILPKDEFYRMSQADTQFHELFDLWEKSSYNQKLTPSVDRIDSSKGYSPENIRWIPHSLNSSLAAR